MRLLTLPLFLLTASSFLWGQDPAKVLPQTYKVLLENDKLSAIDYHLKAKRPNYVGENTGRGEADALPFEPKSNPEGSSQKEGSSSEPRARDRLIGTWRLVSAGTFGRDGSFEPYPEYGPHPIGYLIYDPTGHMCVCLSNPDHPHWVNPEKPTDAEKLRSFDAFFAYCGTYEIREKEGRVIHRPEMGSWPHYIRTDQNRNFRLEGDRLILSGEETPPGGERRRYQITWERVNQ